MGTFLLNARHSLRILKQNPGFAAIAILSLALGIGANTAIFTLINTVLLKPLPVSHPEQLVNFAINPDEPQAYFSNPDFEYIRDHNQSFSGVMAASGARQVAFEVTGDAAPSQLIGVSIVSGEYFDVLGVIPAAGRVLDAEDNKTEDAHPYVVLDYSFWKRRFGGDPDIAGRKVMLNGSPFTIVGVSRAGFTGTVVGRHPDAYAPIMQYREIQRGARDWNTRRQWWLNIFARLKPGVTIAAATPEMDVIWQQILKHDPEEKPPAAYDKNYAARNRGTLLPASGGYNFMRKSLRKPLVVLMVVVALVLLIACANVANLMLARATARQREIAIRLAIGAGRARLIGQLVTESLVMAAIGGVAGIAIAWWGVRILLNFFPRTAVPYDFDFAPDWRVLAFSFGACLLVGLLCGIAPAIQSTRPNLTAALKSESAAGGRIRFDTRRALVVLQVALSLLLLIGAGLFVRTLSNLQNLDPGFQRESVLLVDTNPKSLGRTGQQTRDFYDRLMGKIRAIPNIRSASLANVTPLSGSQMNNWITAEGYVRPADEKPSVHVNDVSDDYFATLGIPIVAGRDFRPEDNPATSPDPPVRKADEKEPLLPGPPPVAIVTESFAKKYLAGQNPIGKRFTTGEKFDMARSFEIVGVVKDASYFDLRKNVEPMVYFPVWRFNAYGATLCLRTTGKPELVTNAIRREIAATDPAIPVLDTETLAEQFDDNIANERAISTLCGFFGGLAVVLAAIGLYGVMAYTVTRRYREIGIRMALGAEPGRVLWLVLKDTAWMIGIGAAIGLPAAFGATRLIKSFLYGLTPQDPLSIAVATIALMAVTGLAGYFPARRATRVDPLVALRQE